ncbi:MAG TPA: HAD family hydrolase [Candidatus Dormibacteraeota bacterium]|nr:HAD family hydrolase [Candidatus Dormibacteraeota bacterium]
MRPAVFLDRDGTVSEEVGYLNHVSRFKLYSFAAPAIRRLNEAGVAAVVVTNQSGVGRGYFPESLVEKVHQRMLEELASQGAKLDRVYYCAHVLADNCECRKPKVGMLQQAARELHLDVRRSFVVGDRYGDLELAHRAGARGVLVRTGYGEGELAWHAAKWKVQPDHIADDLQHAVDWILRQAK